MLPVSAHPGHLDQLERASRLIESDPGNQALYIQRGMLHTDAAQFEEALADFAEAERLGPAEQVALGLGVLHYRAGDLALAASYLDRYLDRFPTDTTALEYRARVARDAGDLDQALASLEAYLHLSAQPTPGHFIAAAEMLHEKGDTRGALAIIDRGLERLGNIPQLQRQAVRLELQMGQASDAVTRWETVREVLEASPRWKLEMTELLLAAQRPQAAGCLLRSLDSDLATLRATPARQKMQQQASALHARLRPLNPGRPAAEPLAGEYCHS